MTTESLPQHTHHALPAHEPLAALRATAIVVALTTVLAIIAIAFALPAARSKPHDVPIGAVGPQTASGQGALPREREVPPPARRGVAGLLEQNAPGAFAVTTYPDEAALVTAIRDREVYGGISLGQGGPKLLIATGASPTVAQLLTQVGNGTAQHAGVPPRTEDLAPPTANDPRGAGLAASALPITLAGLLPAVALVVLLKREVWTRFAAVAMFSGLAALTIAALLRYVLGSIGANFWGVTGGADTGRAGRR